MPRSPAALAVVALALHVSQEPDAATPAPAIPTKPGVRNLVVVTLDTVRADHCGCYGYPRPTTPHLDELARECVRFTRCLAPIAQTTPSHSSLFTGVYPYEHGVLSNFFLRPADERQILSLKTSPSLQTLAQVLKARGVKTGGFAGATPVKRFTGLAAGFDEWTEPEKPRRVGREVIADALRFIDGCGDEPFFVWVHLFDAHGPIDPPFPPQSYVDRFRTDAPLEAWLGTRGFPAEVEGEHMGTMTPAAASNYYDGALRFLDDQFDVLIQRLRRADRWNDTALVVVGDHGQGLGQHGTLNHGLCWDEHFRVPLLLHVPGVAPAVVDVLCSTIDVLPTVLARAPALRDDAFLRQCRGADVLAEDHDPRPIFGMSPLEKDLVSLTASRWKLMRRRRGTPASETCELFDLEADPFELEDVAADHADVVARLGKLLAAEIERQQRSEQLHHAGVAEDGSLDPKILEELRALGYVRDGDK